MTEFWNQARRTGWRRMRDVEQIRTELMENARRAENPQKYSSKMIEVDHLIEKRAAEKFMDDYYSEDWV